MIKTPLQEFFIFLSHQLVFSRSPYQKEIEWLHAEKIRLQLRLDRYKELKAENDKLKRMLSFKKKYNLKIVPVSVINIQPSTFRRVIVIDGGRDRDFKDNAFVLDENGYVLGKIQKVHSNYSEVVMLNDPNFSATVEVNNNLGLAKGTLGGMLKIFYIEEDARGTIKKGDIVWLRSNFSQYRLSLGRIKTIDDKPESLFLDITVEPFGKRYTFTTAYVLAQ